ncbi:MAG: GGDEF domain-containing protein [Inhella sp.]
MTNGYAASVARLNFAELLLVLVASQQLLAAVIWLLAVRLRVAPRVPSLHWVAASVWVAVCAGLPVLQSQDRWYGFGLPALLLPGALILTRLGLEILFRQPRRDAEHLLVILLALGGALLAALLGAGERWWHVQASLLSAACLLRGAACVHGAARRELGLRGARLVCWPLALMALLFTGRVHGAWLQPEHFAQPMTADSPSNITLLMVYLSMSVLFHVMLSLTVALRLVGKLQQLSRLDPLTGLSNRRGLEERWASLRHRLPLAALAVDADHFKDVNDRHGHAVGDQALQHLAELMRRSVRSGDGVVRLGGEEFLLLLAHTDPEKARQRAEQLRALVAGSPLRLDEGELALTVSIGVAVASSVGPPGPLISAADAALYEAKRSGRNRVVLGALQEARS